MPHEGAQPGAIDRIPTGIPGLDDVLDGGVLAGSVQLIVGPPGSGKTIMANQIAYGRAAKGHTAVYVTLLAEAHARMLAHLAPFSFFDPSMVSRRILYMSGYGVLDQSGLDGLLELLSRTIREHGATILVLDGLGTAEEFAPTASTWKRFLLTLSTSASLTGCTTFLLATSYKSADPRLEQATVDGILELDKRRLDSRIARELAVQKMRATNYQLGTHSLSITSSGVSVYPRLEARPVRAPLPLSDRRLGFDVDGLDAMLGGGVLEISTTLLTGRPGTGKTLLGMCFLEAGARRDEPGIYLGFRENAAHVVHAADGIGLDVSSSIEKGMIALLWEPPSECGIDEVAWKLLHTVERTGAKRVLIDGLDGFRRMATEEARIERFLTTLAAALCVRGVTMILTQTTDTKGLNEATLARVPSAFLDNVLVMRESEKGGRLRRYVSSQKLLGGAHDVAMRRLRISSEGFSVDAGGRGRRRSGDA